MKVGRHAHIGNPKACGVSNERPSLGVYIEGTGVKRRLWTTCLMTIMASFAHAGELTMAGAHAAFVDPLDTSAVLLGGAQKLNGQPVLAAASVGSRIVAVGLRGLVTYSDNRGVNWSQAAVPVQSDLVGIRFVNDRLGWAVGHDGVILRTDDAGAHWVRQFDFRMEHASFTDYYGRLIDGGATRLKPYLDQVKLNTANGSALPWLATCFDDEQQGYVVGSFGMIARTTDGGKSWVPWLDHIDNDQFLNLNAIRRIAGQLYIVGEKGSVYRFDPAAQRFNAISTGYTGSFFDIAGTNEFLLAVGLRGSVFRSVDGGTHWTPIDVGTTSTFTGATVLHDGRVILAAEDGSLLESADRGLTFRSLPNRDPAPQAGVALAPHGDVAVFGYAGIRVTPMDSIAQSNVR